MEQRLADAIRDFHYSDKQNDTNGIWWLASYPKSGNTWLRAFLSSYSKDGGPVSINALPGVSDNRCSFYQRCCSKPVSELSDKEILHIRPSVLLNMDIEMSSPLFPFYVKTHSPAAHDYIVPVGLTAGAIYVVRDPRQVAVSLSKHMGISVDDAINFMSNKDFALGDDKKSIRLPIGDWSLHVDSWTCLNIRKAMVRYEDLVDRPKDAFKKIVVAIGYDLDDDALDRAIEQTSLAVLRKAEKQVGFSERKNQDFFFGGSEKWQDVMTDAQVAQIEKDHGAVMKQLGYDLESEAKEAA